MPEPLDFALLGHPGDYAHLSQVLLHLRPHYDPNWLAQHERRITQIFEWMSAYEAPLTLRAPVGDQARRGRLLICTFMPHLLTSPRQMVRAYQKVAQACRRAQEMGAQIVGLGGFTSIITGDQGARLIDDLGIAVTSGNTLTAVIALDQLDALMAQLGLDLAACRVGIIGATGDIGRACTLALAQRAGSLRLIARNPAKLDALRAELDAAHEAQIATDVRAALDCQVLLVASSSPQPVLAEAALRPGTIVCDISYPKNLSYSADPRADVLAFSGGLVQMPFELPIGYYTQLPRDDLLYACFAEAILLSMAGRYESFSSGQGQITPQKMAAIRQLAHDCGFRPAPAYRGGDLLDAAFIQRFQPHLTMDR